MDDGDSDEEDPLKVFQFGVLGRYCWIRERSKHLAKAGEEEVDISGGWGFSWEWGCSKFLL